MISLAFLIIFQNPRTLRGRAWLVLGVGTQDLAKRGQQGLRQEPKRKATTEELAGEVDDLRGR